VNGIISIVTRSARDTQGLYVTAASGTSMRVGGAIRYGTALGNNQFLRLYLKGFDRDSEYNAVTPDYDESRMIQGGIRFDADVGETSGLSLHADAYSSRLGEFVRRSSYDAPYLEAANVLLPLRGGDVLARWRAPLGDAADYQLNTYYSVSDRDEYPVAETRHTWDVDLQARYYGLPLQELTWGVSYRLTTADLDTGPLASLPNGSEQTFGGFLQDEISLAEDRVRLFVGAKAEHNQYSGLEVQPSARLTLLVNATNTFWASVTRAVRRPSRVERLYTTTSILNPAGPAFIRLNPNPDFGSEKLLAYEAGYRIRRGEFFYFTIEAFYNDWNDLLSTELGTVFDEPAPPGPDRTIFPVSFRNGIDGNSHGFETTVSFRPATWWRGMASYAYLHAEMAPKPGATDLTQESRYEDGSPVHQVGLRSSFDLIDDVTLDGHLRYVSELPDVDIPSYATTDVRVSRRFAEGISVEAVAKNLHQARHAEWPGDNSGADVEIERSLYVGMTWRH
jgi:iron complex outermembrane receptor protein